MKICSRSGLNTYGEINHQSIIPISGGEIQLVSLLHISNICCFKTAKIVSVLTFSYPMK